MIHLDWFITSVFILGLFLGGVSCPQSLYLFLYIYYILSKKKIPKNIFICFFFFFRKNPFKEERWRPRRSIKQIQKKKKRRSIEQIREISCWIFAKKLWNLSWICQVCICTHSWPFRSRYEHLLPINNYYLFFFFLDYKRTEIQISAYFCIIDIFMKLISMH